MSLKDITRKPKIGFLGIMQELYDNTLPNITKRQEGYAREVSARLAGVADVTDQVAVVIAPPQDDDIGDIVGVLVEHFGVDGVLDGDTEIVVGVFVPAAFLHDHAEGESQLTADLNRAVFVGTTGFIGTGLCGGNHRVRPPSSRYMQF